MAAAAGGPLVVPGFASYLVSARDFRKTCAELVQALQRELGGDCSSSESDQVDDSDILVDDLKILTDAELVEQALQESPSMPITQDYGFDLDLESMDGTVMDMFLMPSLEAGSEQQQGLIVQDVAPEGVVDKKNNGRKRKVGAGVQSQAKVRRRKLSDRELRVKELSLDSNREMLLTRLKQERELARKNALCHLHCLKRDNSKDSNVGVEESSVSKQRLRYVTSILKAPSRCNSKQQCLQKVDQWEVVLDIEFYTGRRKVQEFLVLGSQPLTALRDQFYCLTDELARAEQMKIPSGYFLIEDVFYNDMRDCEAVDYSEPILKWVAERQSGRRRKHSKARSFKTSSMAETCFMDLNFRLGAKNWYQHQGGCKHAFVIKDIRLVHRDDAKDGAAYPVLKFLPLLRHKKCSICDIYRARRVTSEDQAAPTSPCFFCNDCYYLLHYDRNGKLLSDDFRVSDYYHEQ